jgi:hypothetical protein
MFDNEVLNQLKAVIDCTSENCPVENVSAFHDGKPILDGKIMALADKLRNPTEVNRP